VGVVVPADAVVVVFTTVVGNTASAPFTTIFSSPSDESFQELAKLTISALLLSSSLFGVIDADDRNVMVETDPGAALGNGQVTTNAEASHGADEDNASTAAVAQYT